MMKMRLLLMLISILLMTGCQTIGRGAIETTLPSKETTSASLVTTEPTESTGLQTEPTEESTVQQTETTEPEAPFRTLIRGNYMDDDTYYFIFDGSDPFSNTKIDISNCVVGAVYRYKKSTEKLTLITNGPIDDFQAFKNDSEHIFYVLKTDRRTIMRTDMDGKEHAPIYTAQENVWDLDYYGYPGEGSLYFLEGSTQIKELKIPEMTVSVIYEGDNINGFSYAYYRKWNRIWLDMSGCSWIYDFETGELIKEQFCS